MLGHLLTVGGNIGLARRLALLFTLLTASGAARVEAAGPAFLGTFTEPTLCSPRGVAVTASGDVIVGSDCITNPHMARFTGAGTFLGTWSFGAVVPNGVAVDGLGFIFVTDYEGNRIRKFTSSGLLHSSFATAPQPADVAVNGANEVFVLTQGSTRVQKFTNSGALLANIGSSGSGPGQFMDPNGIAVDASGRLYVSDYTRRSIIRFLANGSFDVEFPTSVTPTDVAVGPDGNIYVISFDNPVAHQYSLSGTFQLSFRSPDGLDGAHRLVIGPSGSIYITEQYGNRVSRFLIDQTTAAVPSTFGRLKALYR